jgi:uncharacterized protein YuzE
VRWELDTEADAAYLSITDDEAGGAAVEQVVVGREGRGDIVLDFNADGRLLGVEVLGASALLRPDTLEGAEQR